MLDVAGLREDPELPQKDGRCEGPRVGTARTLGPDREIALHGQLRRTHVCKCICANQLTVSTGRNILLVPLTVKLAASVCCWLVPLLGRGLGRQSGELVRKRDNVAEWVEITAFGAKRDARHLVRRT